MELVSLNRGDSLVLQGHTLSVTSFEGLVCNLGIPENPYVISYPVFTRIEGLRLPFEVKKELDVILAKRRRFSRATLPKLRGNP